MLVLLGLEEAKRDALLAPTKCELGISEVPQSRDPHFRNPQFEIPHSDPHFPNSAIRNPQFAIRNPQSLPPLVFWVFALQFLFDLWIGLFPEV
jgi:hypothetical protein